MTTATLTPAPTPAEPAPGQPPAQKSRATRRFLPEVQALRALAVALVVVYHLRPDVLPGGYIGVDVFFVISGFLITGHMLREVRATGRLRLGHFWANRARRILPASLLVVAVVLVSAPLLLPVTDLAEVGRQGLASVLYVQNWALVGNAVDYLASDTAATPFQHFWSLAVEEQFYILWPLVVLGAAVVARRAGRGPRTLTTALLVAFGVLVAASFAWNLVSVGAEDPAAYFSTATRLWELGAGGLLAVTLRWTERFRLARSVLALAGFGAIGVGAATLTAATPFPGTAALLPVLGTMAVIAAGRTSGAGSLTWFVDRRPVQWLGNVSYSLYLWHFPVIVWFTEYAGGTPTRLESLGLLGLMLVAAGASYTLVEQPLRSTAWLREHDGRSLGLAATSMAVVCALALVPVTRTAAVEHDWDDLAAQIDVSPGAGRVHGAHAAADGTLDVFVDGTVAIRPNPVTAVTDLEIAETTPCESDLSTETSEVCEYGDPTSDVVVAMVGDSHIRMLSTPLANLAEERGWRLLGFFHNSCPFSYEQRAYKADACAAKNAETMEQLRQVEPDAVITSFLGRNPFRDTDTGMAPGVKGLADLWNDLHELGASVYVVKDVPEAKEKSQACVAENYEHPERCAVDRQKAMVRRGLVDTAAEHAPHATVIDFTDFYCDARTCHQVVGNVLVYRDRGHLTDTFAQTLQPYLAEAIPARFP
ncbi:acyltransferase family protein [Promicromonospora sp. NPDC050880]|uniref:acyltransferase family protein n=1 Tax=Promicromonospora sp. NPDC050880 TaxID=3364406 RepID=UPI0037A6E305